MELALLKYSLMIFGGIVTLVSIFVFARLTNWVVWLKGNIPVLVGLIGVWFVFVGVTLQPYVAVTPTHGVMNASVLKVADGQYKLLVDDGLQTYELIGEGNHFQTRTVLAMPNAFLGMLGFPAMVALDSITLETSNFEQAVLAKKKEQWERDYGLVGAFGMYGVNDQAYLSRQLPLREGALYSLVLKGENLVWVATNEVAEKALGDL